MKYDLFKRNSYEDSLTFFSKLSHNLFDNESFNQITKALSIAFSFHKGQLRDDGLEYIVHPIRVAIIIMTYEEKVSLETIIGALFHDILEDTNYSELELRKEFGKQIGDIVHGVTRYRPKIEPVKLKKINKTKSWQKVMNSERKIRIVKTADYFDNMLSWKFIPSEIPAFQKLPRWIEEAEQMYIPLAYITNKKIHSEMLDMIPFYKNLYRNYEI